MNDNNDNLVDPVAEDNVEVDREVDEDDDDTDSESDDERMPFLDPVDRTLQNSYLMSRLSKTNIANLMAEGINSTDSSFNLKFIEGQLMRIICPQRDSRASVYNRIRNRGTTTNYSRILMFRQHDSDDGNQIFYMMMARAQNTDLFNRNIEFRDNGVLTIGSYMRILAPMPITTLMNNETPMVESNFPIVALLPPERLPDIRLNMEIQGESSLAFVINGAKLAVRSTAPIQTGCSGLFCDKQRLRDIRGGCGCFHMINNRSNLAFLHNIRLTGDHDVDITVNNFSSTKFSLLYLSQRLPPSVKISALNMTNEYFVLLDCITHVLDVINNNGGFTVIGWYRRGIINDRSLIESNNASNGNQNNNAEDIQVGAGEVNYHVIDLYPTDTSYLDKTTLNGMSLNVLKFDVTNLSQV